MSYLDEPQQLVVPRGDDLARQRQPTIDVADQPPDEREALTGEP